MKKSQRHSTPSKRALVLGCGGVAGGAWSIAMMAEVEKQLGINLTQSDVFIGTSVGAVLAALLSAGASVDKLLRCQTNPNPAHWDHNKDTGGSLPPLPRWRFNSVSLVKKGLRGELPWLTAAMGALPQGRADMEAFKNLIGSAVDGDWTDHKATWLMVADADTGERVALGRDITDIPMTEAVCASYGVPSWCPPVHWQGRTFLDGGIASPTSADLLVDADVDEAIVIAPMASTHPDNPWHPFQRIERRVRRYMTGIVDNEIAQLRQHGIRVLRLEPCADDLQAFGYNMMDPKRRQRVLGTAIRTSPDTVTAALAQF